MKQIAIGALLIAMAAVAMYGLWNWVVGVRFTDKDVARLIDTHIPTGSNKTEVIRFLDARNWQHSDYQVPRADVHRDPNAIEYKADGVIYASTGQNMGAKWFLDLGHIGVVFVFDRRGELAKYKVQQWTKGYHRAIRHVPKS